MLIPPSSASLHPCVSAPIFTPPHIRGIHPFSPTSLESTDLCSSTQPVNPHHPLPPNPTPAPATHNLAPSHAPGLVVGDESGRVVGGVHVHVGVGAEAGLLLGSDLHCPEARRLRRLGRARQERVLVDAACAETMCESVQWTDTTYVVVTSMRPVSSTLSSSHELLSKSGICVSFGENLFLIKRFASDGSK